jgi:hypothetical protein
MEKFTNYLISKSIIPEAQVRYYIGWVRAFFRSLGRDSAQKVTSEEIDRYLKGLAKTHEDWQVKLDDTHITNFLTHLAVDRNIAASTQNQAFNALLFFFRHVLEKEVSQLGDVVRSKKRRRLAPEGVRQVKSQGRGF